MKKSCENESFTGSKVPSCDNSFSLELKEILAGIVGGARFGYKVRFPHALLMTIIFKRKLSAKDKLRHIFSLVFEHSSRLGAFAGLYKVRTSSGAYL